jgi:NADH-quinone oxidoreductase subunit G
VGQGALARPDGAAIAALAAKAAGDFGALKDDWNGYCVLHTAASRVAALDLGLVPGSGGKAAADMAKPGALDLVVLLGADEIDIAPGAFVIYLGTHGDRGAHRADVILPGAAYPEKTGLFVNTEGRVQMANRASFPPGDAREDWAILRALSDLLGARLPFDSLGQLRAALFKAHPYLQRIDTIATEAAADVAAIRTLARSAGGSPDKAPFRSTVPDFYLTNPISRASADMAECSALAAGITALTAAE